MWSASIASEAAEKFGSPARPPAPLVSIAALTEAMTPREIERLIAAAYDSYLPAFAELIPPLIKAYLRVGAQVGDGAVIDHQFNTVDVLVVMPVAGISARIAQVSRTTVTSRSPRVHEDRTSVRAARVTHSAGQCGCVSGRTASAGAATRPGRAGGATGRGRARARPTTRAS